MNKDIRKIKLAITTDCNLSCPYCFVRKTKDQMRYDTTIKAVNFLIHSTGKEKLLSIYGGEPLLNFKLIEKICPYAALEAKKLNKKLTISVCTNCVLLTEKLLDFFKKFNIKLIISMAGDKISHDQFRKFTYDRGSYEIVAEKLPIIFKRLPLENIGASFCIFPSLVNKIEDNFMHLVQLGFRYINFEIIRDYQHWTPDTTRRFSAALNTIIKFVVSAIPKRDFIYLNPVNWEIKFNLLSRSLVPNCPFNYKLEVYPNGEMAFSPFLLNSLHKNNYIIGNINEVNLKRFNDCRFNPVSIGCLRCEHDYFKDYVFDQNASGVYNIYHDLCLDAAKAIAKKAVKDKFFSSYVKNINKVCF